MTTDMDALHALTAQMSREGIRRLLVISGEPDWCERQADQLRRSLGADGLWISPQPYTAPYCAPGALKTLLGREFQHAVFDARHGFDVAAFAALAGTLRAGSWLILLTPDFAMWPASPDADSVRWSDCPQAIATPHFIHHFCRVIQQDAQTVIWRQHQPLTLPDYPERSTWRPADGRPLAEQAQILQRLKTMNHGIAAITAGRGRGKSALAGMLLRELAGTALVTAPAKAATDVMAQFAGDRFRFLAPDALALSGQTADWLIVDEAAAIPGPLLEKVVSRFPRTLLLTTVQGYEGTGRGFVLKFCARFPHLQKFTLDQPIRWAQGCPLETVVADTLLFDDNLLPAPASARLCFQRVEPSAWRVNPALPSAMYRLLSAAHYRTSPLDLRRMMDAPGQHFACVQDKGCLTAAVWLVEEGGLSAAMSHAVWAGFRRPRGNLVAQSLAAHGGSPLAATLNGQRISRIAVHPQRQREGIGVQMIRRIIEDTRDLDYLSVSFGYTDALWRFWKQCGFTLVRLGTHREASSGCYAAMAIYPLSDAAEQLVQHERQRFQQDVYWLDAWRDEKLAPPGEPEAILTEEDWPELAGFAFAHRPFMTALGSLNRLIRQSDLPLPFLRARLRGDNETALCEQHDIHGRKALLIRLRGEVAEALKQRDAERCYTWQQQIAELQDF